MGRDARKSHLLLASICSHVFGTHVTQFDSRQGVVGTNHRSAMLPHEDTFLTEQKLGSIFYL